MRRHNYLSVICLALAILASCSSGKKEDATEAGVATVLPDTKNEVKVLPLKRQTFHHELVSNGKVSAKELADLKFESAAVIAQVYVKNGDRVRKGQKLAELDKFRLANRLAQAKDALERAQLELQDVLIGQGYAADDRSKVPAEIMQLARVKSGYDQSKAQYDLAKYEEEHGTLIAPFSGVVANLFAKSYNLANPSEVFCTIIDSEAMEADFTVLENELSLIKQGDNVLITPYASTTNSYEGNISQINPLVDDKGMVRVKARVNGKGKLFSGMNVRVSVQRSLDAQMVIAKSAVVLRSGKQVVFTFKNGNAQWNYIQTGLENTDSYTVAEGLKEGDTVIVSGNINLAHEAPVTVIE